MSAGRDFPREVDAPGRAGSVYPGIEAPAARFRRIVDDDIAWCRFVRAARTLSAPTTGFQRLDRSDEAAHVMTTSGPGREDAPLAARPVHAWKAPDRLDPARAPDGATSLVGSSVVMQGLRARIERVASTDFTTLIEGESGTGKELVARRIHELSRRRGGPFVAINCAALVDTLLEAELFGIEERTATGVRGRRGKFEIADGGTLFLDEVSDLSAPAQAKLLRAIQDLTVERVGSATPRRVDARLVAATNRGLAGQVARREFREDLYYRLAGVELHVPALRRRGNDVLDLARCFLDRHRHLRDFELSSVAADALLTYGWPGNVRELERLVEGVVTVAQSSVIHLDDLPPRLHGVYKEILAPSVAQGDTLRAWGSRYVRLVLARSGYNKRQACRALDISYHTLQSYLRYRPIECSAQREAAEPTGACAPTAEAERGRHSSTGG